MNNSDVIRDLGKTVSMLEERLNNAREEISRVDGERTRTSELVTALDKKLILIDERIIEIRKLIDERDRRRWTVIQALITTLLGLIAGLLLWYLKK